VSHDHSTSPESLKPESLNRLTETQGYGEYLPLFTDITTKEQSS